MTGKIHKLTSVPLPGEVDAELVAELDELLAQAKRGEVIAAAWVVYRPNDTLAHGWSGAGGTRFQIGAGIMALHAHFARLMVECEE